jgi:hypothetical protein
LQRRAKTVSQLIRCVLLFYHSPHDDYCGHQLQIC